MINSTVTLYYVKETLTALEQFDKEAVKAFKKTVNKELVHLRDYSRKNIPDVAMRNWKNTIPLKPHTDVRGGKGWPAWDPEQVKANIRVSKAKGKVRGDYTTSAGALINRDPAGAIFEIAGRKSDDSKSKSGQQFKQNLKKFGSASRVVWRAVDRNKEIFDARIAKATEEAKQDLQKALQKQKTEN